MSSEPLDRQIVVDHLDRTMMMGTAGNRAEGNEGEHRTSMRWGAWDGETGTPGLRGRGLGKEGVTGKGPGLGGTGAWVSWAGARG
jgi:hypothetical protein